MTFKNNHKQGAKKLLKIELDDQPICFKGKRGQKEALKQIPGWQNEFREFVDRLISGQKESL